MVMFHSYVKLPEGNKTLCRNKSKHVWQNPHHAPFGNQELEVSFNTIDLGVSWNRGTPSYHPFIDGKSPWNRASSYGQRAWGTTIYRTTIYRNHHWPPSTHHHFLTAQTSRQSLPGDSVPWDNCSHGHGHAPVANMVLELFGKNWEQPLCLMVINSY